MYKCIAVSIEAYHTTIDNFMVDVVENIDSFEAYLYHVGYSVKVHMFSVDKARMTKEEFLYMVSVNLYDCVDAYMDEYN